MGKYLKLFENHTQYEAFTATTEFIKPNVSYCVQDNEVHYNPWVAETRLVAKYNVTDTSSPTRIGFENYISGFSDIEIDGVIQPSVVSAYTFDTLGEHTIKYTLTDPTSIGEQSFNGCSSLTSVTIPDSVTSIDRGAFSGCSGLASITFPNSITSIGSSRFADDSAFAGCSSLTSIDIPSGITNIGNGAFVDCSGLTSITINAITPPNLVAAASMPVGHIYTNFNYTNDCPIYVPSESVAAYKSASGWSTYASRIQAIQ